MQNILSAEKPIPGQSLRRDGRAGSGGGGLPDGRPFPAHRLVCISGPASQVRGEWEEVSGPGSGPGCSGAGGSLAHPETSQGDPVPGPDLTHRDLVRQDRVTVEMAV